MNHYWLISFYDFSNIDMAETGLFCNITFHCDSVKNLNWKTQYIPFFFFFPTNFLLPYITGEWKLSLKSSSLGWKFKIEQGRIRCGRKKLRLPILSDASMLPTWSIQFGMHIHDVFSKVEKLIEQNGAFSACFDFAHCLSVVPTHSCVWLIMWTRSLKWFM